MKKGDPICVACKLEGQQRYFFRFYAAALPCQADNDEWPPNWRVCRAKQNRQHLQNIDQEVHYLGVSQCLMILMGKACECKMQKAGKFSEEVLIPVVQTQLSTL